MRHNPFLARKHRPIVVGHRGVPAVHQENTLAGFRRAVSLGVPAVELDVRLTRDRRAVVLHDATLRRLTGTPKLVANLTWDELSRERIRRELPMGIDARGELVIARYDRQEPIPLLEEVLAEVGGRLAINIELKLDLPRFWHVDVGNVVARLIRDAHVVDSVIVTSFDPRKLRAAGRAHPDLAIGFCFDDGMLDFARTLLDRLPPALWSGRSEDGSSRPRAPGLSGGRRSAPPAADPHTEDRRPGHNARRVLNRLLDTHLVGQLIGTRVVGAEHTLVGADTVRSLHARGVAIGTHTLFPLGSTTGKRIAASSATIAEVERLVALGVDWIETDDPERLLALVG